MKGGLKIRDTAKPALSDHAGAKKKWSLNRAGLLIEVKCMVKTQSGHDQVLVMFE